MSADGQEDNWSTAVAPASGMGASDRRDGPEMVSVGLVASPELGERIARHVSEDLPDLLADQIDDQLSWKITTVIDPLTGSNLEAPDLLDEVSRRSQAEGWDYAVCLTDLPIRRDERIVVAGVSIDRRCAWVSLPALGVVRQHSQVRSAVVQLMREMHWGASPAEPSYLHPVGNAGDRDPADFTLTRPGIARRDASPDGEFSADVRYEAPKLWGTPRLLVGMVHANTPWTLFPSFKATIATAFATGAYGLIFPTLWKLGDAYELVRLIGLMLAAMGILITWIVIAHNLWESHPGSQSPYLTTLYNTATVLTIATGVVFAYAIIFVMILLAGMVFVPDSMLENTLQHPASPRNYVRIAWVTASVATIAGAVGAGLEDSEAVRDATFGWRQHKRFEKHKARNGNDSG